LHRWASHNGYLAIVKLLVQSKATIDLPDCDGKTPLEIAKSQNHTEIVQFLESVSMFRTRSGIWSKEECGDGGSDGDGDGDSDSDSGIGLEMESVSEIIVERG
jgi:hypothetical protein